MLFAYTQKPKVEIDKNLNLELKLLFAFNERKYSFNLNWSFKQQYFEEFFIAIQICVKEQLCYFKVTDTKLFESQLRRLQLDSQVMAKHFTW